MPSSGLAMPLTMAHMSEFDNLSSCKVIFETDTGSNHTDAAVVVTSWVWFCVPEGGTPQLCALISVKASVPLVICG